MFGFDRQKTKQVAKTYVKHKAKAALSAFLKSPPGFIITAILLIVLLVLGSLQAFIEAGEISNRLDEEHNQMIQKDMIDIAREKSGTLLDYYGTDEDLALNAAWILSYYKYLQLSDKADITNAKDFEEYTKELAKQGIKSAVNMILPQWYIYRKIKGELVNVAERMKPRFLYIKTERRTVTTKLLHYSMPRTYTWTVEKQVYNPETGEYETQTESKSQTVTVKWTEKIEVTETQPIWLIVAADTIKQRYSFSYGINEYKRTYQNNIPQKTQKTKSQDLKLDFDPEKFIENKNCLHASDLGINSKFELKTNFDSAEKEQKPSTGSKTLETSPEVEEPAFSPELGATNTSHTDGEKKLEKEEILQIVETVLELSNQNTIDKEYERLEEMILEDNPEEDIALARTMIVNSALSFLKGTKDATWLYAQIDDYMEAANYENISYIPAQYFEMFKEAEKLTGIPFWFLAGVAYRESSFNPKARAKNSNGWAIGIMQVQKNDWKYWIGKFKAKFPNVVFTEDIENPRDNILIGSYILYDYTLQMTGQEPKIFDWQGDGWKEQMVPTLAAYNTGPENAKKAAPEFSYVRKEYVPPLISAAEKFKLVNQNIIDNNKVVKPITPFNITSFFGIRKDPFTGNPKQHNGIDIAAYEGQPVYAVTDAVVTYAGWMSGYGKIVILKSGEYEFRYAHLLEFDVTVNQKVKKGEQIGSADSTGTRCKGPHLHFEVRINDTPVDPLTVIGNLK